MYEIKIRKKAQKELKKLPVSIIKEVVKVIDDLASDPYPSGVKKLKGSSENLFRIRKGDYRVIYLIEEEVKIIDIRKIAHRKDVYNI